MRFGLGDTLRLPGVGGSRLGAGRPFPVTLDESPAGLDQTRVGRLEPIWYVVPEGIVKYIAKRGLYLG